MMMNRGQIQQETLMMVTNLSFRAVTRDWSCISRFTTSNATMTSKASIADTKRKDETGEGGRNDKIDKNSKLDENENLCTKRALQLSLSPPRCPPYGTAHRSILSGGGYPQHNPLVADHHYGHRHAHSYHNHHHNIRERIELLMHNAASQASQNLTHPHLTAGPELADQITRFLGTVLPTEYLNHVRDTGGFRTVFDSICTYSAPLLAISNPRAALSFMKLTKECQTISYGSDDPSQFVDVFFPDNIPPKQVNGMVFFVHGGAWGSGYPWMYRLCALPFLRDLKMAVAIVGYRVYPTGDVPIQVQDLQSAYDKLTEVYPDIIGPNRQDRPIGVCISGHSSGAHIAMMMIVEHIKKQMAIVQKNIIENDEDRRRPFVDSFVGISGPYDISHHFDYEAARGVEEFSPMKAANGFTRQQFHDNSPHLKLKDFLASCPDEQDLNSWFPPTLLVHGIEDDTVPFTATSETAYILRSCGITQLEEFYVPLTLHQETVMHLMLGGRVERGIVDWLQPQNVKKRRKRNKDGASTMVPIRSRL